MLSSYYNIPFFPHPFLPSSPYSLILIWMINYVIIQRNIIVYDIFVGGGWWRMTTPTTDGTVRTLNCIWSSSFFLDLLGCILRFLTTFHFDLFLLSFSRIVIDFVHFCFLVGGVFVFKSSFDRFFYRSGQFRFVLYFFYILNFQNH